MSVIANNIVAGAAGQGGADAAYQIDRSLRFNSADSAYLNRTPSSAGNRKTWTWAGWVKRSKLGTRQQPFAASTASPNNQTYIEFNTSDQIRLGNVNSASSLNFIATSAIYRDTSAWYHIVVAYNTTDATASNRVKLYVNGSQVTQFASATYPALNYDTHVNNTITHAIGRAGGFSVYYTDAYLADVYLIDGQALDQYSFGEFDANGIWQPKAYTGSYGTNGFHLPFSDNSTAAALGTDTSGNGNDWTVNNIVAGPSTTSNSWSGYFGDATADYITTPSNAAFGMGTGDWTVEGWFLTSAALSLFNVAWFIGTINSTNGMAGSVANNSVRFRSNGVTDISSTVSIDNQWTHIAWVKVGSTNTVTIYVNGTSVTSGTYSNSIATGDFKIGYDSTNFRFVGYISNLRVLKGTAQYTSNFTPPTAPLTAITNTSLLTLQDSTLIDNSTNNFTLTAYGGARVDYRSPFEESPDTDSLLDSPTNGTQTDTGAGAEVVGNYATLNPLISTSATLSNGNLDFTSTATYQSSYGTIAVRTGKWYWEATVGSFGTDAVIGVSAAPFSTTTYVGGSATSWGYEGAIGRIYNNAGFSAYGATFGAGDTIGVAFDADSGKLWFAKNGTWQASGDPAAGVNPAVTLATGLDYLFGVSGGDTGAWTCNFGQRPFAYTAPSGYKALCTTNLPDPTIADGSTAMDVVTYTGNGSTQTISGLNFSPDLVWSKSRSFGYGHSMFDTVRGAHKYLASESTNAESDLSPNGLTAFNSDGWTESAVGGYNASGSAYVAWTWDGGTSTVSNTDGSITSSVRANASTGFSIVSYTGNGTAGATIGHGLNGPIGFMVIKNRDSAYQWLAWHESFNGNNYIPLNTTDAVQTNSAIWNGTSPSSSVITLGTNVSVNENTSDHIAYCFAPVSQYSSFGVYTGNGSTDGPFVYTGFRPAFVLIKGNQTISWHLFDNKREGYNVANDALLPNSADSEFSVVYLDLLSNGFKVRQSTNGLNSSNIDYIYAAFAENPFKTARAR